MSFIQPFNFTDFGTTGFSSPVSSHFHQSTAFGSFGNNRFTGLPATNNAHLPAQQYQAHQTLLPLQPTVDSSSSYDNIGSSAYGFTEPNQDIPTGFQPTGQVMTRKRRPKKLKQRNSFHSNVPQITRVTPIEGPIYARDGFVPVVPLYSYPSVSNGTFYQIPILWTALSVALGLEVRGEILRGLPCIKRHNQLFCPTAGNTYPLDKIEAFIDENKALIKRMYGEFMILSSDDGVDGSGAGAGGYSRRRSTREVYEHEVPDVLGDIYLNTPSTASGRGGNGTRFTRQTVNPSQGKPMEQPKSNRIDSCESKVEITTPYWAANSAGKVRAIVNTKHFEQAIHQEICTKSVTSRCSGQCGCEQKYKWHRLLSYDPENDCKGVFMDWFLFGSCCVCRCDPGK